MVAELVDEEQAERIACHHGVGIEGEFADGVEGLATRLQEELDAARLRARVVHDFHHADIEEMTTGFALLGLQANEAVHDLFGTDGNTIGQSFRQFADIEILQNVEESRTGLLLIVVQGVVEIRRIDGLGSECETIDHGIAVRNHPGRCKTGGKGDDDAYGEEPPEQPGEVVLHHPLRGQDERRLGEDDAYRQPNPILGDID